MMCVRRRGGSVQPLGRSQRLAGTWTTITTVQGPSGLAAGRERDDGHRIPTAARHAAAKPNTNAESKLTANACFGQAG